ncbi:KIDINS220, partial [Symbiodinium sp. CCMP2456]
VMCRFTQEPQPESTGCSTQVVPTAEDKKVPIRVKRSNLEKLIAAAVEASHEASNNASLKRRIRQRLHKKLGSILSKKDFAAAMDKFKQMTDDGASPTSTLQTSDIKHPETASSKDNGSAFQLPVERTFIHFQIYPTCQRRSSSVPMRGRSGSM